VCIHCRLSEREKALQNAINAMYRFDSDVKDYSLWLTKVDVVLGRYSELMSDPGSMDSSQRQQIIDSLKVGDHSVLLSSRTSVYIVHHCESL